MTTNLAQQFSRPSRWPSPGENASSRLALDLAMGIKTPKAIAEDYGLQPQELVQRLQNDRNFSRQVSEYRNVWLHPMNAAERVRIKAAVLAEDGLLEVWRILVSDDINPSVRLDAHKHVSRLADVEPKKDLADGGSRFSVTINLPSGEAMQVVASQIDDDDFPDDARPAYIEDAA